MQFDLSRDILDGIVMQHPQVKNGQEAQIRAGGQLQFLPSSADGLMHTAIVSFGLFVGEGDQPFARGGWRFMFTSAEKATPAEHQNHPFMGQLLVVGSGKIMVQINNLMMHAGLPMIPFDPTQMGIRNANTPPGVPAGAVPVQPKQG
ncbi:MAG: hypothetical protein AAB263_18825 [Planctomycetota bacterium]